jgi:hypothetical protein
MRAYRVLTMTMLLALASSMMAMHPSAFAQSLQERNHFFIIPF